MTSTFRDELKYEYPTTEVRGQRLRARCVGSLASVAVGVGPSQPTTSYQQLLTMQLLDWTGRQLKPGKRGAIPKNAPAILDRLNPSPERWLHAVEHFGKRRTAKCVTPAARLNATAGFAAQPVTVR